MTDHADAFEHLASRGEPRGADEVVAAADRGAEQFARARRSRQTRTVVVAFTAILAVATAVGVVVIRDTDHPRPSRVETGTGPTTPSPTAPTTSSPTVPTTTTPPLPLSSAAIPQGLLGQLAWVDGTGLVTASSSTPDAHVAKTGAAEHPAFSFDGRWLSYTTGTNVISVVRAARRRATRPIWRAWL